VKHELSLTTRTNTKVRPRRLCFTIPQAGGRSPPMPSLLARDYRSEIADHLLPLAVSKDYQLLFIVSQRIDNRAHLFGGGNFTRPTEIYRPTAVSRDDASFLRVGIAIEGDGRTPEGDRKMRQAGIHPDN